MEPDPRIAELGAAADPADAQFRLLVETVSDYAIFLLDPHGRIVSWNAGAQRIKGYAAAEIVGRHFSLFYVPEDRASGKPRELLEHAAREGRIRDEGWRVRSDGSRFWADVVITALRDDAGRVSGFAKVTRDMTELRRSRERVQASEARLHEQRTLLAEAQKVAGLGSWEWDPASGRLTWSDELYRMYGVEPSAFQPTFEAYLARVHPEDREHAGAMVARALIDGLAFTAEERIVRPDGAVRWLRSHCEVVRDRAGRPLKLLAACLDITESRASEQALRAAAASLQALSRRLVEAEEAERRRIAGELHDRVGQNLSALNINLDIILGALGEEAPMDVRVRLRDSLALVDGTLQAIENVMADLRPPLLEEYGLGAALGWYAEEFFKRTGIEIDFIDEARERNRELRRDAAVALFRVAQEALNNVAKHANARRVTIGVRAEGEHMTLEIRDDGAGFDPAGADARASRWGMTTMRERAEAAGGRLEITSARGTGTVLRATVPF